uniref:Uncharacterized protein n=1 Tax=Tanacetum cinerariifolium TaxID=118510 RepID=A0A699IS79_TANCI|nr:hypothetical protein [Tanacetum cinerariifolium]
MYHKKNVDFPYLLWEDFVYQVEHKDAKKSNEMYYLRFTKVIINFFITKDPSDPRRNKVNWHYVRDDQMLTTIKLVSRHQNTQQFDAILPFELTNEDIKKSASYKEYYAIVLGAAPPKMKASMRKTQSNSDTTMPPPTAASTRLSTSAKGKQPAKSSKVKGLYVISEVAMTKADQMKLATKRSQQQTHISQASRSGTDEGTGIIPGVPDEEDEQDDDDQDDNDDDQDSDNDGDDFVHPKLSTHDEEAKDKESFDPIVQTSSQVEDSDDESNDDESHGMNVGGDEGPDVEDDDKELYRDVNINLEVQQAPAPALTTSPSTSLQDLPNFSSFIGFDHRLKNLEANFSEFMQTNQFAGAVSFILGIVDRYIDHRMNEAVKVAVQLQSDRLRDEAQSKNEDFINKLDENIQTSYVVAADLSKMELKKILIEKLESNKFTLKRRRDDVDKDQESLVGSDRGSKRRREGKEPELTSAPKDKASKTTGKSTEGSKSHQKTTSESAPAEEPMQATQDLEKPSHQEFETCAVDDQAIAKASQHPEWFQKETKPPTPDRAWNKTLPATHGSIQPWISNLANQADSRTKFNELMDTPVDFSAFLMNRLKVDTLTPELIASPTYELMKGSCKSLVELEFFLEEVYKATTDQLYWNNPKGHQYLHNFLKPLPLITNSRGRRVIPFDHFINNNLKYLRGGASSRKYTTSVTKIKAANYGHIKWIEDLVPRTMWSQAPVSYDKYALWGISH